MIDSLSAAYEISLLALITWREARSEPFEAKFQVAWTVRNRVEHPKWWGKTFSEVILKRAQYSSMWDQQSKLYPLVTDIKFIECLNIAYMVYQRIAPWKPMFPSADSYYDNSIPPPIWATEDKKVGSIGVFNFYNIDGSTDD